MKLIIMLGLFSTFAFADVSKAPDKFAHLDGMATFVDFTSVESSLEYNIDSATVTATSRVQFEMLSEGYAIFDLIPNITSLEVNGIKALAKEVKAPSSSTKMRVLNQKLKAGTHSMIIANTISTNVKFSANSVRSAFWMSDLSDRKYMEQYLPSNFEYDLYQQSLEIKVIGDKSALAAHKLYTNGAVTKVANNHFKVIYPEYFSASSLFFHLVEDGAYEEITFEYESISGKMIPIVAYKKSLFTSLAQVKSQTLRTLKELETKLGAWSHPSLVIYIAGRGGMEHSGATITSMYALEHEITHSFFARGVMPISGNSGWIDEAIASWRDDGYKAVSSPNFSSTTMAAHSQYRRTTDRKAYTQGANFMAFLNKRLESQGGLIAFLSDFYKRYTHTNISTKQFREELEKFSGEKFSKEFNKYIFGMSEIEGQAKKGLILQNPNHPKRTKQELLDLL